MTLVQYLEYCIKYLKLEVVYKKSIKYYKRYFNTVTQSLQFITLKDGRWNIKQLLISYININRFVETILGRRTY